MSLGTRIKAARERLDLTQKEVGDEFGITDQAVSGWENDRDRPDLDKIPKLAAVLKVPTNWLLSGTGVPPDSDDIQVRLEGLTPAERAAVNAMIESFHSSRGDTG